MKTKHLIIPFLYVGMMGLWGCGGSDGQSPAPSTQPPAITNSVLSGMASKGPIKHGTIKVYAVKDGVADMTVPISQGLTDANGAFLVDIGSSHKNEPVVVEVTGGAYVDEVSGVIVNLQTPIHSAVPNVGSDSVTVAVTPLTELAYKKAKGSGKLTAASIDDANKGVGNIFSVNDIISSLPIPNGSTDDQKKHAAACGSFSQLVNNNKGQKESMEDALTRTMSQMGDEEEHNGGLSGESMDMLNNAILGFDNSGKNDTGTTIPPVSVPTQGSLKLGTSGETLAVGGIDITVKLPAGITVNADPITGETVAGVVKISGVAASGSNLNVAKFTPANGGGSSQLHIALINTAGFGEGEFVTINFNLSDGTAFPAADAFTVADFSAKALDGSAMTGVTAKPMSVAAK